MYAASLRSRESQDDVDIDEDLLLHRPLGDTGVPLLRSSARKLRHVVGITLRNLTLQSPEYAKRRESLQKWSRRGSISEPQPTMRRKSTLTQTSQAMGVEIENQLKSLNQDQLLDSMFAIYNPSRQKQPVYISEVACGSMNPEFKEIDFRQLYCRNDSVLVLTIWARKHMNDTKWSPLSTCTIDLSDLVFVGKDTNVIRSSFPSNTFIVLLEDGCYVTPAVTVSSPPSGVDTPASTSMKVPTCSFDTIMKLNNLEECIDDSEATIRAVSAQLESSLSHDCLHVQKKHKSLLENKLKHTNQQVKTERRNIRSLSNQVTDLRNRIKQRKEYMHLQELKLSKLQIPTNSDDQYDVQLQRQCIAVERSRIASELQVIFPITPILHKQFEFSICGLPLPDAAAANYDNYNDDKVGAAYGFAAQLVHLLSEYLQVPLRYPVTPYGANSFIVDPISTIQGSRTFPLWIKGSLFYRFEYGVYLFHKDMEQLINSQNLAVADLSHTLANLKNLLLVLSSAKTA